jgi:transcriptional regulator with XRE-family HTH domain
MSGEHLMETTDPVWTTPAVEDVAAAGQFGALIRMTRTARRLSLVQAGGLLGYSASTLSRIETGQRKLTDVTQLRHFAETLGIPPHLFGLTAVATGAAPLPAAAVGTTVGEISREGGDDPVRRRELLAGLVSVTGAALLGSTARPPEASATPLAHHLLNQPISGPQPVRLAVLRTRVANARATFHACRYSDLAANLPDVIATAQATLNHTSSGQHHDQLAALLADAYSLASNLCSRLHDNALAWVTAERARANAAASGDPASIAEAARMTSIAMRHHGHHAAAATLLTRTAIDLGAQSGTAAPDVLATYGSLLCTAAYTAAQLGNRHKALDLITEADTAATRLGSTRTAKTPFSAANVTIYRIGVHTALGDSGTALTHARTISLRSLPTPERQARFCLDTARAWHRYGNPTNSVKALQTAERCAPEELRRSSVRTLISALLNAPGPTPAGLRELATRSGVIA